MASRWKEALDAVTVNPPLEVKLVDRTPLPADVRAELDARLDRFAAVRALGAATAESSFII